MSALRNRATLAAAYTAPLLGEGIYLAVLVPLGATHLVTPVHWIGLVLSAAIWFWLGRACTRPPVLHAFRASLLAGALTLVAVSLGVAPFRTDAPFTSALLIWLVWWGVLTLTSAAGAWTRVRESQQAGAIDYGLMILRALAALAFAPLVLVHSIWAYAWMATGIRPAYGSDVVLSDDVQNLVLAVSAPMILGLGSSYLVGLVAVLTIVAAIVVRSRFRLSRPDWIVLVLAAAAPVLLVVDPAGALEWFLD